MCAFLGETLRVNLYPGCGYIPLQFNFILIVEKHGINLASFEMMPNLLSSAETKRFSLN